MKFIVDEQILQELLTKQNRILELINKKIIFNSLPKDYFKSKLLTVSQSAEHLNVSEIFLRKKIEAKVLKVKRIGKAIRIDINDLESLIED
ncbi:MAG: hypothetical protein C0626_00655 [Arcobacter sp.]|uniref:helix-turn-helix domain-containing protein n=1 Tax=uncultured Arcobacter sp. TaxID=165434 RepID=UPI000CAB5EAF|nr:helix-turn-helix domain-containing protein [uncultured Arcobacter sp.]PLY11112.1 MAG: hypothetical protein C0626_00655 [Arcobacter sp.]